MWTPPCDIYMYLDAQGRYSATPGRTLIFLSQIKCAAQGVSHFTNSHAECNDQHGINSHIAGSVRYWKQELRKLHTACTPTAKPATCST